MTNESKILELLAEYLRKTDRLIEKMDKFEVMFEKQSQRLDVSYQVLISHSEKIESLQQESKDIRLVTMDLQRQTLDLQHQTKELQNQTKEIQIQVGQESQKSSARSDALVRELIGLSKKVKTLERKR